jgi:hypothetical protein
LHRVVQDGTRMADDTFTGCRILQGVKKWYKDGKLHRDDDLPAEIWNHGTILRWYRHGYIHRDGDLPAEVYSEKNHIQIWRQFNKMHREHDKPAWISDGADGFLEWWVHGKWQTPADRLATQQAMRWSACRAAFVAACAAAAGAVGAAEAAHET